MKEDSQHSIVLARSSFHSRAPLVISGAKHATLCLLCLDRSGSMARHGDVPRQAVNELIQTIQGAPGAERTFLGVLTFGDDSVTMDVVPMPAKDVQPLASYAANGSTPLYLAVDTALQIGLEFRAAAHARYGAELAVAISVVSDGDDTASSESLKTCREHARLAREMGFALQTVGIGIDSVALSRRLGFSPGLARTHAATAVGVQASMDEATAVFTSTMMGGFRSPSPPPKQDDADTDRDSDGDSTPTPV